MKEYTLPISWGQSGLIKISANNLQEAIDTLQKVDTSTLAVVGVTIPKSMNVVYPELFRYVSDEFLTNTLKLYVSSKMPKCPHCTQAKEYLKENDINYVEIDLATDEEARTYVRNRTGSLAVPQIEVGNELVRGFVKEQFEMVLEKYQIKKDD